MTIMILAISLTANIILGLTVKIVWDGWGDDVKAFTKEVRLWKMRYENILQELNDMEDDLK